MIIKLLELGTLSLNGAPQFVSGLRVQERSNVASVTDPCCPLEGFSFCGLFWMCRKSNPDRQCYVYLLCKPNPWVVIGLCILAAR